MTTTQELRAMREAKFARARAASGRAPLNRSTPQRAEAAPPVAPPVAPADTTPEAAEALCGHRNMGGRTCTREAGHAAKSHRYS